MPQKHPPAKRVLSSPSALKVAIEYATLLKIPIYELGGSENLQSLGTVVPYKYEDGVTGITNGIYTIHSRPLTAA